MILDRCTFQMDLFSQEIYYLFGSGCARVRNPSFGGHHGFCIKQFEYAPSGKLTLAHAEQCCFTSTETTRTVRDGEPRTATSSFIQLLSSAVYASGRRWAGGGYKLGP